MPNSATGRLLIVDDEVELLNSLSEKLAKQGYETVPFGSPREALLALKDQRFDLMLTDLMMPEMDGIALLQAAREIDADLDGIVMTGQATVQTAVDAMKKGAVDYILKPFKISVILPALVRALEMRRLRLENIRLREAVGREEALRQVQAELEMRVKERTADLTRQAATLREQAELLDQALTERKRFEEALQAKNLELVKANDAKDNFLAGMSHELRTPLNAIIGFTGVLLMKLPGPLMPDQENQLRTIEKSAKHLLSLINDILDLAKIESGKVDLKLEPIALQSVVQEVATTLRPIAEGKGVVFEISARETETVLNADRRAVTQILINLVTNAVKFTETGSVSIELSQQMVGGRTITAIRVVDTGIGIPPEEQARLFKPFAQVDSSIQRRQKGTGLGLHLSRKLAELMGATITLQSEYGKGSTLTLEWRS